jgi:hypothetical protein
VDGRACPGPAERHRGQAIAYGPIVLARAYGANPATAMPHLDPATIAMTAQRPLTFRAQADNKPVTLLPVARTHHQHYTVYWDTAAPAGPAAPAPPAGRFRLG